MKKKYIWFNVLIVLVALIAFFSIGILVTNSNYHEQSEQKIKEITRAFVNTYTDPQMTIKEISKDIRVTVVDATGTVLADSGQKNVETMENHIGREEIIAAINGSPKTVTRRSETLGVDMVYYAEKAETGDGGYVFIRTAMPVQSMTGYIAKTVPLMLTVMLFVTCITLVASILFGMHLLDPVKEIGQNLKQVRNGNYHPTVPHTSDDEINQVITEINNISYTIQDMLHNSENEKKRLDYILDHISNGILAIERKSGKVLLCNRTAANIFRTDATGRSYTILSEREEWNESLEKLLNDGTKISGEFVTDSDTVYSYTAKMLDNGIAVVVMNDITAERMSERMRSEFFANASHELKTPLTAIKGFNEIIGLKSNESEIKELSEKIGRESDRMIALLADMLDLSKLENKPEIHKEKTDVAECADDVVSTLSTLAREKDVTVRIAGEGFVYAEREHIVELLKNLIENGIRYNYPGGAVDVLIESSNGKTVIKVKDNGIGIEEEHQSRIFERFYRVSKSRSRETGGTGLGLAIVKHICELYGADLALKSKLGVGTEITVSFNK